jgi:hypothetical protein
MSINRFFSFFILAQLSSTVNETMDNTENVHPPSTSSEPVSSPSPIPTTTNDKRSIDENDEPHLPKRLRSSCSQSSPTTMNQWIPPSKQFVTNIQSQSTSLFQFTLSLVHTIYSSIDDHLLTEEHLHWLHSALNSYGHNYNPVKINLLIETASLVAKISLVR